MPERKNIYFVADVHLGLPLNDPAGREKRFCDFLSAIPAETTRAVYLLGDIWDFWYEYRDVIPREGVRVIAQLVRLMDAGVEVWFCEGNHDMWSFSFFESLGMKKFNQPYFVNIDGKEFCLGHGDGLGGAKPSYRFMLKVFHNRFAQRCFSTLHPWLAFRFGLGWSNSNRRTHEPYHFKGEGEPLHKFASEVLGTRHVDYFVFGHFHDGADVTMPGGAHLIVVKDWIDGGTPYCLFDGEVLSSSF